jgi:hypothetical protein
MSIHNNKRVSLKSFAKKEIQEGLDNHFEGYDETNEEVYNFFMHGINPSYSTAKKILSRFLK